MQELAPQNLGKQRNNKEDKETYFAYENTHIVVLKKETVEEQIRDGRWVVIE